MSKGYVYLVGAGPGDPGLITVKGRECIARADVIIYDYLASPRLLVHARDDAEMIYVGKKGGDHTLSQDGINQLIVDKALAGNTVTRLKGGDPFIFGRGGEEAESLIADGIQFEIVPGVTSAIAAPAYAGIPLTHRAHTTSVAFITGHEDPTKSESTINWQALATGIGTVVFLMGVKNLPRIVSNLIEHGRSPDTPVALVRWGTTSRQRTVTGTLSDIVETVKAAKLKAPAIIVVGDVVQLRDQMAWFERRPLLGKRIVVTRARHQASALVDQLSAMGADCLQCPTIRIADPESWAPLDAAIDQLDAYNWLVFTSVNGVTYFFDRLFKRGLDVRALHQVRTAVIGPATRDRLAEFGIHADILPVNYRAESVADAFAKEAMSGQRVLLPRALEARPVLPEALTAMGAAVDEVVAYQTVADTDKAEELLAALDSGQVDMVTFTSSSTVTRFLEMLPTETVAKRLDGVSLASIGPITTETAQTNGLTVSISADEYTIPGLCDAIVRFYTP